MTCPILVLDLVWALSRSPEGLLHPMFLRGNPDRKQQLRFLGLTRENSGKNDLN